LVPATKFTFRIQVIKMKRLVYSPSIKVWVKTDSGVINLTPYVTECRVSRKVNEVSQAEIEFRNPRITQNGKPRFMFTQHENEDGSVRPVFHPMDPIVITLERLHGKQIQVFTGYCDTTPYVQLVPGVARIKASCTLKRLLYTYWDPGLNFTRDFMKNYGWDLGAKGQVVNQDESTAAEASRNADTPIKSVNLNDSSIGNLLYATLNEVGGWNPGNIYIQPLPTNISSIVGNLFDELTKENSKANEELSKFLKDAIGSGSFGYAAASGTSGGGLGDTDNSNYTQSAEAPKLEDNAPQKVKDLLEVCDRMCQVKTTYVYGGGHDETATKLDKTSSGAYIVDCSSFTSYALASVGLVSSVMVSGQYLNWGKSGVGKYFTVWTRDDPSGHVFIEFYGKNNTSSCVGTNSSKKAQGNSVSWHTHPTTSAVPKLYPRHWQGY